MFNKAAWRNTFARLSMIYTPNQAPAKSSLETKARSWHIMQSLGAEDLTGRCLAAPSFVSQRDKARDVRPLFLENLHQHCGPVPPLKRIDSQ